MTFGIPPLFKYTAVRFTRKWQERRRISARAHAMISSFYLESHNYRKVPQFPCFAHQPPGRTLPTFAKLFGGVLAARIIRRSDGKVSRKKRKVPFRFSRIVALICAHLLISSPPFTVLLYLPLSTANRFSIWLLPRSFCILASERRPTTTGRVIFKMLERTAASRVSPPFLSSLSSSAVALFRFFHRHFVHLSLIWVAGSFRSMKFESRSRNLARGRRSCLSFLPEMEAQRTRSNRNLSSQCWWSRDWSRERFIRIQQSLYGI